MSFVNQFTVGFTDSMFDFGIMLNFLSPFTILNDFVSSFNDFIRTYTTALEYNLLWIAYEALIIVGFYFWAVNVFKKRKGEDSEQVSNDFFTYPLVVNLSSVLDVYKRQLLKYGECFMRIIQSLLMVCWELCSLLLLLFYSVPF